MGRKAMLVLLIAGLVLAAGCAPVDKTGDIKQEAPEMTEELCEDAGGQWNECSSPCAGMGGGRVCIQVCAAQCECNNEGWTCPEGYSCRLSGERDDEVGACILQG